MSGLEEKRRQDVLGPCHRESIGETMKNMKKGTYGEGVVVLRHGARVSEVEAAERWWGAGRGQCAQSLPCGQFRITKKR